MRARTVSLGTEPIHDPRLLQCERYRATRTTCACFCVFTAVLCDYVYKPPGESCYIFIKYVAVVCFCGVSYSAMALGNGGVTATANGGVTPGPEKAPVVNGTNMETLPRTGKQVGNKRIRPASTVTSLSCLYRSSSNVPTIRQLLPKPA